MIPVPASVSGRAVTNRGVHLHPNGLHNYWMQEAGVWQQRLVSMHISWVLALSEGDNILLSGAAEALLDAGVIPIVRFGYQYPDHFTHMVAVEKLVALYARYGAPCIIQFGNEPFDNREWKGGEVPEYEEAWSIIASRYNEAANIIAQRGAYPGFPDGPCYGENPFYRIGDPNHLWVDRNACYLGHYYGKGRPVDYPYDDVTKYGTPLTMEQYRAELDDYANDPQWNEGQYVLDLMNEQREAWAYPGYTAVDDPTCWRGWERVAKFSKDAFGFQVEWAMTEGGWVPRDRAGSNPQDIRWPYTTPKMVAKKTLAMYEDAPASMFAVCPWLLADQYMAGGGDVGWPYDAWVTWAYADKYGAEKPVVQALRDNPPTTETPDIDAAVAKFREAEAHTQGMIDILSGVGGDFAL